MAAPQDSQALIPFQPHPGNTLEPVNMLREDYGFCYSQTTSPFTERGGTWKRARRGGGVHGDAWVFGKGLAVFGFSRPTGATYLLGVVLMHRRCIVGEVARHGTAGSSRL